VIRVAVLIVSLWIAIVPRMVSAGEDPVFDHLHCMRVRIDEQSDRLGVDLRAAASPPLAPAGCRIRTPAKVLCTESEKTNVVTRRGGPFPTREVPAQPAQTYLCYELECATTRQADDVRLELEDQFGAHQVIVRQDEARLLCAPARRTANGSCGLGIDSCAGTCAAAGHACLFDAKQQTCGCVPSSARCGAAGKTCGGRCEGVIEQCRPVIGGTGCECVPHLGGARGR
jgi:hypothetical protein